VTIAGSALAKKHYWKIRSAELQSVKAANNEHMLIEGVASVSLARMENVVSHSADEPDNRRAPTSTAELPMERDNDAAPALGTRPNQEREPVASHNGAQRGATANTDRAPVYALHIAESPTEHAERQPHYDGSPSLFDTPEGASRSPDSAYVNRPMEPDAAQWTMLPPSEYQTPSRGASSSTLAPNLTTKRADKSEQLTRKDRRASSSPRASHREQHPNRTSQGSGYDVKKAAALRRKARSTHAEEKGSSTDGEQGARSPQRAVVAPAPARAG